MTSYPYRFALKSLAAILATAGLLAVTGCNDSSPTEPRATPGVGTSASLTGEVTVGTKGTANVTVRIQSTGLGTTTDAQGRFFLSGLPTGNQVVLFEHQSASGSVGMPGIQAGEQIDLRVSLEGGTVVVQGVTRNGSASSQPLTLQLSPSDWNTNWTGSSGRVTAFLRGEGYDRVDLSTVALVGSGGDEVSPMATTREGDHVKAQFPKADAFDSLDEPEPGEVHTVILRFDLDGATMELTAEVTVVGPGGDDGGGGGGGGGGSGAELTLEISPADWNTNWVGSSGQLTAFLRGEGYQDVDLGSVVLVGSAGVEVFPISTTREGDHVKAKFPKADAFLSLDDPHPGEVHTVILRFDLDGVTTELTFDILVVGPDDDDDGGGPGSEPLSLEIQPDSWNTNWPGSSGTVSALLRGDGYGEIDLGSVVLIGSAGVEVSPSSVDRQGNHVRARFPKSAAFLSLQEPQSGQIHTVTVRFDLDGTSTELTADVRIVGP